ncbi:MAG: hypothetical protein A2068_08275 [Ignavibacteria bacterium GWB2_35_6b]|nr:MAG: hypothetical protein A2068_08275 [Ignavibacteria bacterium GWB2_35_6b]
MKKQFKCLIIPAIFVFISCSPTSQIYETAYPTLNDGKYDSEFPYKSSSKQLEEISHSIKMINVLVFYTSYFFDEQTKLTAADLQQNNFIEKSYQKTSFHQPSSGTATVIRSSIDEVVLLTCAHIIDFPDTIITYHSNENGSATKFIESVSIKNEQSNYIPDFPDGGKVEIIAVDNKNDLALIGRKIDAKSFTNFPKLNYPKGKAKELEWGSFIYAFGYPLGQKMISKGIVSSPNFDGNGTFLIDAVFNRGFSGGVVLAIRDGVPNFELVGLVRSVPAEIEYILRPAQQNEINSFNPTLPYKGEVYIDQQKTMKYGVTRVIPIEVIEEFINKNGMSNK